MPRTNKKKFTARMWSLDEVKAVAPLVRSIIMTIREKYLLKQSSQQQSEKIKKKQGRPNREEIIEMAVLAEQESAAADECESAVRELQDLGCLCYDPVRAVAVFPFGVDGGEGIMRPAWFVYTPFSNEVTWRYEGDTPETRRPVAQLESVK